jgi:hypothetical protein
MMQAFAPVFVQSGSRQQATIEIIGEIVQSIGGMGNEEFDVFRAHMQMLKFGMMSLQDLRIGSTAAQVLYDWTMAMGAGMNYLSQYGDYRGFETTGRGSVFVWTTQNPVVFNPQVPEVPPAPVSSPEPMGVPYVFMRERSPSPVLPGYYH